MKHAAAPVTIDRQQSLADVNTALRTLAFPVGVVAIIAAVAVTIVLGGSEGPGFFLSAYLTNLAFFMQIALGSLFIVMIHFLVRAGWNVGTRRVVEFISMTVIPLAICASPLAILVFLGNSTLYPWVNHDTFDSAARAILEQKEPYLNGQFFLIRFVIYLAIWTFLSTFFFRNSLKQDQSGDPALTLKMERTSTWGMFLFAGALTFFAFDFIMSLDPFWFSTMFGVTYFAGSLMAAHSFLIIALMTLQRWGLLRNVVTVEHYHDYGKLLFGYTCFWAYVNFSQYFLIWYANIPEETKWFLLRQGGTDLNTGWEIISSLLAICVFAIPFVGMMSRHVKRNRNLLFFWACWTLVFRMVDMYWLVMPERLRDAGPWLSLTQGIVFLSTFIGLGGIFVGSLCWIASNRPILPIRDPRLPESLAFKNV